MPAWIHLRTGVRFPAPPRLPDEIGQLEFALQTLDVWNASPWLAELDRAPRGATGLRVFLSLWGFEEFDDVAGGIDADDLLASLVLVEFVPELHALLPQLCNV